MTEPSYEIDPAPAPELEHSHDGEAPHTHEPVEPDFKTAFLVVTRHDGSSFATTDLATPISLTRDATLGDIQRATSEVLDDLRTNAVGQTVMAMLMQQGEEARKAAEKEGMRRALAKKGINVPASSVQRL